MRRFVEGEDRKQVTLLPECLDDFVAEDNPVRIIEAFVGELDLGSLGFDGAKPSGNWRRRFRDGIARTMPASISCRCPALGRSRQLMSNQGHRIGYGTLSGIDADIGGCRFFVGGIDTREILDSSLSCQLVKAFGIAPFCNSEGHMHVYFNEPMTSGNRSCQLPTGSKGGYGTDQHQQTGVSHESTDFAHPSDVFMPILVGEAEILTYPGAQSVPVQ